MVVPPEASIRSPGEPGIEPLCQGREQLQAQWQQSQPPQRPVGLAVIGIGRIARQPEQDRARGLEVGIAGGDERDEGGAFLNREGGEAGVDACRDFH